MKGKREGEREGGSEEGKKEGTRRNRMEGMKNTWGGNKKTETQFHAIGNPKFTKRIYTSRR